MFGYVKTYVPELRVREHEYYKGTYCGLCKSLGRCTGQCSRMTLNYDFVTFTLLRVALTGEKTSFKTEHCILHPVKKRNVMNKNPELCHAAYSSAIISYHKVLDDISDEGFFKRLYTRIFLLPSVASMRKKALKNAGYSSLDETCKTLLGKLYEFEKDASAEKSVDIPAELFGKLLAEFLAFGLDGTDKKIALSIGLHLGKWVYIADALDDMKEDKKLGRYNPFLRIYDGCIPSSEQTADVELALKNELMGLERALDLIDFGTDNTVKNILFNIIYLGMPKKIESIVTNLYNDND
ncbi:MAG: hypothetical protein IKB02_02915 [Clostridia bacterium]|nr:hypothetical protein [Clostridia bacterium]